MTAHDTTMMSDDMNIDFTSFYQPAPDPETRTASNGTKFEKKEKDETRKGQVLDCTNPHRLGMTLFCLIPDKVLTIVNPNEPGVPRLYRRIQRGFDGSIVQPDNEKMHLSVQIPRTEDFKCNLLASQRDCLAHLQKLAGSFVRLTSYEQKDNYPEVARMIRITNPQQIVYTYGKLLKFISQSEGDVRGPEIGQVRVFKFAKGQVGKNDFATALNGAIQSRSDALGSTAWMGKFFNRCEGTHEKAVSLRVSQAEGAIRSYMINTSFEDVAPYEVTAEDLSIAENLDRRVFNIEEFDDEYYHKLTLAFDNIQNMINSALA
ncbi:MAG: hypothetical protein MJZ34_02475 [Paludibacteraceae bacterium]|nr:hypothetical protein [Paludibacteraceae bacterium]